MEQETRRGIEKLAVGLTLFGTLKVPAMLSN
jgi:hypothetical protein